MNDGRLDHREVGDPRRVADFGNRGGRRGGRLHERVVIEAVRVRVSERGVAPHAHAGTSIEPGGQLLDLPVVEADRDGGLLLDEQLREGSAASEGGSEYLRDEVTVQHECGIVVTPGWLNRRHGILSPSRRGRSIGPRRG